MSSDQEPIYSILATDEDLQEIVVQFVEEMPERIARFQNAMEAKDWEELRTAVHQFKGAAGSYGFSELSPIAAEAEEAIKSSAPESEVVEKVNRLIVNCKRATSDPQPG